MSRPSISLIAAAFNKPDELERTLREAGNLFVPDMYHVLHMIPQEKLKPWHMSMSDVVGRLYLSSAIVVVHPPCGKGMGGHGGYTEVMQFDFLLNFILSKSTLTQRTIAWTPLEYFDFPGNRFWELAPEVGITKVMGDYDKLLMAVMSKIH